MLYLGPAMYDKRTLRTCVGQRGTVLYIMLLVVEIDAAIRDWATVNGASCR